MTAAPRLFGVPIRVDPSFFLMAILLGSPGSVEPRELLRLGIWTGVVFVSILWHELGHALAARIFGGKPRIELGIMGGLTSWEASGIRSTWALIAASLAGPLAGFALGGSIYLLATELRPDPSSSLHLASYYAVWINLGWGALNLLPLLPYDGGQAMASALGGLAGERGRTAARVISLVVGLGALGFAIAQGWLWAAFLAGLGSWVSWRELRQARAEREDEPLWERLRSSWEVRNQGELDRSIELDREVLAHRRSDSIRSAALEQLAWGYLLRGEPVEAQAQLALIPPRFAPSPLLQGSILVKLGDPGEALPLLEDAFRDDPSAPTVHALMLALVALNELDRAERLILDEPGLGAAERGAYELLVMAYRGGSRLEDADRIAQLASVRFPLAMKNL
jgi:Zn-dependent protease